MPLARTFIDWKRAALPAAAKLLIDKYRRENLLDMQQVVVVLPGARAGRRLLEILVDDAQRRSLAFVPPRIETTGSLPELLYESKRPFASPLVQQLAWVQALRGFGRRRVRQLVAQPPADDDFHGWMRLGTVLWQQHRELAADGLDFDDVVRIGPKVSGFSESSRWKFLRQIQTEYLRSLDQLGLWDVQTARLFAIANRDCRANRDIVLVATSDMNRATRQMLDQVVERVTALVHSPPELAHRFDEYGCVLPAAWQAVELNVADEQLRFVDGASDQADEVIRSIAGLDAKYQAEQIAIGVPDESLVPQLGHQLAQHGVQGRWAIGRTLDQTLPYQLLRAVATYIDSGRFADFAALVRHADVDSWIRSLPQEGDWLTQLDVYYANHLVPRLSQWLGSPEKSDLIRTIEAAIGDVLRPLDSDERPLHEWAGRVTEVLAAFYHSMEIDRSTDDGYYTWESLRLVQKALVEHQQTPEAIAPKVTARQALGLLLDELARGQIPPPGGRGDAIEMLGWLELPLDMAPALIVTSLNEGFVPTSLNSDLFLPDALRRELGITDNTRRYARDVYALSVLLASRQELTLVAARRDANADPRAPSRLLFATDGDTVARRAMRFFARDESSQRQDPVGAVDRDLSEFVVSHPDRLEQPPDSMRVTSFRAYLACPYRFYLEHVLELQRVDDEAREMDPRMFGTLIHEVLQRFGKDVIRESSDGDRIRRFLHSEIDVCARKWFGRDHLPAVDVQLMQARLRLEAFARWQAGWSAQGWRIRHIETSGGERPIELRVDADRTMRLRGRIDRIDQNESTGEWAVFDYKTGDTVKSPARSHRRSSGEWIDLQLPLYRHFLSPLGIEGDVRLGYICLPKDTSATGDQIADWTSSDLEDADRIASEVAGRVLDEVFWPPSEWPQQFESDYGAICQDRVLGRRLESSSTDGPR